jgi:hypothetical protein
MAGHTAAYDEFLFSFNGGLEFKDDLDLDAYGRATPTERAELDRLLEQKLPEGDPRVARAIAALWPPDRAAAALTRALGATDAEGNVPIARALRSVSNDAALAALRTTLFDEDAPLDARLHAADGIAEIDGAPANASLKVLLDEPVSQLQQRAAALILRRFHLDEASAGDNRAAALLRHLLETTDEAVRARAIGELKRIVDAGSAAMAGYGSSDVPASLAAIAKS